MTNQIALSDESIRLLSLLLSMLGYGSLDNIILTDTDCGGKGLREYKETGENLYYGIKEMGKKLKVSTF